MKVATWNIEGDARPGAVDFLLGLRADVLLLAEVPAGLNLPGYELTELRPPVMHAGQHYAAVGARFGLGLQELRTPAPTSAAAAVEGVTYVCTVLPWPHAPAPPYDGSSQAEQTERAVDELEPWLHQQGKLVWGGDWNHPLTGSLQGFTRRGHDRIKAALTSLRLNAHTEDELAQPKKLTRCGSIDHIASRHPRQDVAVKAGKPYSTHDAYVVQLPDRAR